MLIHVLTLLHRKKHILLMEIRVPSLLFHGIYFIENTDGTFDRQFEWTRKRNKQARMAKRG